MVGGTRPVMICTQNRPVRTTDPKAVVMVAKLSLTVFMVDLLLNCPSRLLASGIRCSFASLNVVVPRNRGYAANANALKAGLAEMNTDETMANIAISEAQWKPRCLPPSLLVIAVLMRSLLTARGFVSEVGGQYSRMVSGVLSTE